MKCKEVVIADELSFFEKHIELTKNARVRGDPFEGSFLAYEMESTPREDGLHHPVEGSFVRYILIPKPGEE